MGRNPPKIQYPMWMVLMSNIDNTKTASWYAKHLDYTYSAVSRTFNMLFSRGLVWKEDRGRNKIIRLTESGEKVAKPLRKHALEMEKETGITMKPFQQKHTIR